jgi:hypothetical protein
MPDISMCPSETCPIRVSCYRNEASGTKPSEWRQAYMAFGSRGEPCDSYVDVASEDQRFDRMLGQSTSPITRGDDNA